MHDSKHANSTLGESFLHAAQGVATAAHERNFKIECAVGILAVILGFAFRVSLPEWLAIVICIGVVLGFECANTALEALVDLASPDVHPLAKRAKDCMAASALITSIAAFIVGVVLFLPRILSVLGIVG